MAFSSVTSVDLAVPASVGSDLAVGFHFLHVAVVGNSSFGSASCSF